jgi:folate-binding protein YgfZ
LFAKQHDDSILTPMKFTTHLAFHAWRPAAWLRVSGSDAAGFLQGQFTNDLRRAATGEAVYGLWLNVKGRVLADSFVVRGAAADEFWVGSYFSTAAVIRERLESFVVADDVTIEDMTVAWAGLALLGEGAIETLGMARDEGFVFRGRRAREESAEWIFPADRLDEMRAQLKGLSELEAGEVVRRRIFAGIAAVPVDIGPGDLPNEGGLETDAISYTKGCYLGQEVMARLKSMGQARRRLLRVAGAGESIPALPTALFLGARKVGELRSAVGDGAGGFVGLAMISLLHVTAEALLAFEAGGAPAVRVAETP